MSLDEIEDTVDKVASPERLTKWIIRIVLLFVLVGVGVSVAKLCFHFLRKVDQVTTDRSWFVAQNESIEATRLEERAAREALDRHLADVQARSGPLTFSRADDRTATQRLNQQILDAERRRLDLIRSYNAQAAVVSDPAFLQGLPRHIDLVAAPPLPEAPR
jgi:hypothetical protein